MPFEEMTIQHYPERVADFPSAMDSGGKPLETCLPGLISTTGWFQKYSNRGVTDPKAASELAGEALWPLTAFCNELGVDLQSAADAHLREFAELAKEQFLRFSVAAQSARLGVAMVFFDS